MALVIASRVVAAAEPVDLLTFPVHVSATAEFNKQAELADITLTLEQENSALHPDDAAGPRVIR